MEVPGGGKGMHRKTCTRKQAGNNIEFVIYALGIRIKMFIRALLLHCFANNVFQNYLQKPESFSSFLAEFKDEVPHELPSSFQRFNPVTITHDDQQLSDTHVNLLKTASLVWKFSFIIW